MKTPIGNYGMDDYKKLEELRAELATAQQEIASLKEFLDAAVKDANHYRAESQSRLEGLQGCTESKRVLIDKITSLEGAANRKAQGHPQESVNVLADDVFTALTQKLAASQAREMKLREALENFTQIINYQYTGSREAMTFLQDADDKAQAALAQPTDTSALREFGLRVARRARQEDVEFKKAEAIVDEVLKS